MKVFVSFSGEKSKRTADALVEFLPKILPTISFVLADTDIAIGERWQQSLERQTDGLNFAILCVSHDNVEKPWLMYEAGQLSRKTPRLVPYLLNVDPADLKGPLAHLSAVLADKGGTRHLLSIMNDESEEVLPNDVLNRDFESYWPEIKSCLDSARKLSVADDVIGAIVSGDANIIQFSAHGSYGGPLDPSRAPLLLQDTQMSSDQAFERINAAVRQNLEQLKENFQQARTESRQFFRLTLVFASIGFLVVIAAVGLLLADQTVAGIVASVASLIPEATAALFFHKDAELRKTIETYHQHILRSQQVLTMIDVSQTIENPVERDRMKEQIIFKVLDIDAPVSNYMA